MELVPYPADVYAGDRPVIAIYAGDELIWYRAIFYVITGSSGDGNLSAAAWPGFEFAGSHPGDGTLTAITRQGYSLVTVPGGSGVLSAQMVPLYTPPLAGGGVLSAKIGVLGSSDFSGDGALSAMGIPVMQSTSPLSGNGVLSAQMVPLYSASVGFFSLGRLFGFSGVVEPRFLDLTSEGALSFTTSKVEGSQIAFLGVATLSAAARMYALRTQAASDGAGTLGAGAWEVYQSPLVLPGSGALSATSFIKRSSGIGSSGAGNLVAALAEKYPQPGPSGGVGTMTAVISNQIYQVAANFSGGGNVSAVGINSLYPDGLAAVMNIVAGLAPAYLVGDGVLSATMKRVVPISASLTGGGVTTASMA